MRECIKEDLSLYRDTRRILGGCLRAALANDMLGFIGRADVDIMQEAKDIARFIECSIPPEARGSYEKVRAWEDGGNRAGKRRY